MRPSFETTWITDDPREVARYDLGGHTHYLLHYHFVWRPKFHRRLLGPVLASFLVEQVGQICASKKVKLLGLAVAANHVHLCARLRPRHSPAQVMSWIKSTTSLLAFETYPQLAQRLEL